MITGVAVKLDDGTVLSLPKPARHCHLYAEYNTKARAAGDNIPWEGWPGEIVRHGLLGFVNGEGTFLTRQEAAKHAYDCDQIPKVLSGLFSEDVW